MSTLTTSTSETKVQVTSSELGTIWNTYMGISGRLSVFSFLKDKTMDSEAKNILTSYITGLQNLKNEFTNIFINEKAVIPFAFNEQDITKKAPPLFDDIFHIIFLRQMKIKVT